ncbi:hypothetical protein GCM10010968_19950 [Agrococcus terreus]|uniref:Imidazolonepropionase n=1 Tax=Agrococcus terreus TaxID=574649 RepID=A0ABQ2KL64_9MICO|nr:hypothetical protein GCM10010968_19950 [Agrococcus terreus]
MGGATDREGVERVVRVARARIGGAWHEDVVVGLGSDAGLRLAPEADRAALERLPIALLPPLTDAHVHLGLAEPAAGAIGRALDLGWVPAALPGIAAAHAAAAPALDVRWAGALLTAPGGYPSRSGWAPAEAVHEVAGAQEAAAAVAAQVAAGASAIKVALNADAGPVLDDLALVAIVAAARVAGRPVAAHVQGEGQAERAIDHGVRILAHAPWTERLDDALVTRAAERTAWVTTLSMHVRDGDDAALATAVDNVARFARAGGAVLHGTDLGNGTSRLGVEADEVAALLAAGLGASGTVDALTGSGLELLLPWPARTATALPPDVADDEAVLAALHEARAVRADDLAPTDATAAATTEEPR